MSPRGSQRVDRRRRVLVDETRIETPCTRPRIFRGDDEGPLSRYDEAALQALNAPIVRYLPFRAFSLVVWFLAGLIPIMGLLLLDQRRVRIAQWLGDDALRLFQLGGPGSLARWCSSITFVAASLVILAILSVRRHRRDDYRARFTVWQWLLPIVVLASVDSAVGIHGLLQGAMDILVGPLLWGAGAAWWVMAWGLLIAAVTIRLGFEISTSRSAIAWMVCGVLCYLWCGLVQLGFVGQNAAANMLRSQTTLLLLGHHFVLFALVSYARDVVREAMGITESPDKESSADALPATGRQQSTKAARKNGGLAEAVEPPAAKEPVTKANRGSKKTGSGPPTQVDASAPKMRVVSPDGEQEVDTSRLSRAERKRLKKEMRRRKAA